MEDASAMERPLLDQADALLELRQTASAIQVFDEAERVGADADRCAGGRWLGHMLDGDFEAAWRESDAIRARGMADPHRFWNGEDLRDRRVIVRCLHGYGDAVQMLRYAPQLRELCAKLIVEVPPRLVELAPCFAGMEQVVTWGEGAPARTPEWDVQVEVMELPYLFRTQLKELPIATSYLTIPAIIGAATSAAMGTRQQPRIGIVFTAGEWNGARSLPLKFVEELASETGCEFWNLHAGVADARRFSELREVPACGEEIMALAGVIQELDLVITVDTLAAHLAGALGVQAWVLLQYSTDWRWMIERSDTPWYPSLRLYRQDSQGDWAGVMKRVRDDLNAWLSEERAEGESQ